MVNDAALAQAMPPSPRRRSRSPAVLVVGFLLACGVAVTLAGVAAAETGDAGGPLDLTSVALEQRDVRLSLRLSTSSGAWTAADLAEPGRDVCVTLHQGQPAVPRSRVCVTRRGSAPALSYTSLAPDGSQGVTRALPADVSRPRAPLLEATFLPAAAGLSVGRFAWSAETSWTDDAACASGCADRLPDSGTVDGELGLVGLPPCFGAAARDPARPCENPALRLTVEPSLDRVREILSSFCDKRPHRELLKICLFGAQGKEAQGRFAVVGDSHAAGLKTALHVLTLARRWRGISIVRAGCPATRARPLLPTRARSRDCARWNHQLLRWLADRRDLDAVFLSAHSTARVSAAPGRDMFESARAGYREEIRLLLRRARQVVVIRDLPASPRGHLRCVADALRSGQPPGPACGQPRAAAVRPDPLAAAARDIGSSRVRVIDLTNHVCDAQRCFDVVGGALVHRDTTHLTPAFSASLGPYIVRALGG